MNHQEKSTVLFRSGCNCAQSVFAAFSEECHVAEKDALALASGFGAGIGRMRETCGAFSGLVMLCGMLQREHVGNTDVREEIYGLVQQMADDFKKEFGSLLCRDLLGLNECDLQGETTTPSERTKTYYESRPCERYIAFCVDRGIRLVEQRKGTSV